MLPILYQSPDLILYSYPLLMGLGWGIAYQIFFSEIDSSIPRWKAQILFWGIFLAAWVGSKVFFYLTYPKDISLTEVSFWTGGGFVFYGGFIFGLLFLIAFRMADKNFNIKWLWPVLPALAIGHGIGRIGCLLAGCCFGKPTDFFWGIFLHDHYRHPTQLLEAIGLFVIGIFLLKSKSDKRKLVSIYLVSYGALRLFIEALRGDMVRGMWGMFTPSQWISLALIVSGTCLLILNKNKKLSPLELK
jgi:phosphatidylglycerol:prolipoprotein diacylglycerol transferase